MVKQKSDRILEATANRILKSGYKIKWSKSKGNWVKGSKKTNW